MYKKSTMEKAWKMMMKRLHARSHDGSSFWSRPQPAFRRNVDGTCVLDLLFGSRICYIDSIHDGHNKAVNPQVHEHLPMCVNSPCVTTMRSYKELSNIDFKRIWLETALGHTLYKLGFEDCDSKPFLKASDTMESLALECDLESAVG